MSLVSLPDFSRHGKRCSSEPGSESSVGTLCVITLPSVWSMRGGVRRRTRCVIYWLKAKSACRCAMRALRPINGAQLFRNSMTGHFSLSPFAFSGRPSGSKGQPHGFDRG